MRYNKLLIGFSLTTSCLSYAMTSPRDFNNAIIEASLYRKTEKLKRILEEPNININSPIGSDRPPLMAVIYLLSTTKPQERNYDIIDWILAKGADINLLYEGQTPIELALQKQDIPLIEKLKNKGAKLDLDKFLTAAIRANNLELLDLALRYGATPNQASLGEAILAANPTIVKLFITRKHVPVTEQHLKDAITVYTTTKQIEALTKKEEAKQRLAQRAADAKEIGRMLIRHLGIYTGAYGTSKEGILGLPHWIIKYISTFMQD